MPKSLSSLFSGLSPEVKPYLRYSAAFHVVLLLILLKATSWKNSSLESSYTIDFVGPTSTVIDNQAAAPVKSQAPAKAATLSAPQRASARSEVNEFSTRLKAHLRQALPMPSLLQGYQAKSAEAPAPTQETVPTQPVPATSEASAPGNNAAISLDMANFPYPWYISQVRMALWNQWSSRMSQLSGACGVMFSILPDGSIVDLRVEDSSGDSGFDLAALSAVKDASPFPPLPQGFTQPFLKIHLTLKSS